MQTFLTTASDFLDNILPISVLLLVAILMTARRQPTERRFSLVTFIVSSVTLLIAVGAFNYIVNPFGAYPTHFFLPLRPITRDTKMTLYDQLPVTPQALILGSSRTFSIDPAQIERLWEYPAFNASVIASDTRDALAFTRYALQTRGAPRLLILNVSDESFRSEFNPDIEPNPKLWDYLDDDPVRQISTAWNQAYRLLMVEETRASLRSIKDEIEGVDKQSHGYFAFEPNGMGRFQVASTLGDETLTRAQIAQWVNTYPDANLDTGLVTRLRQLLDFTAANQVEVIGYIPPFYPRLRETLQTLAGFRATRLQVKALLDSFESEYPHFRVMDFSDDPRFTDDSMFIDIVHPSEAASRLMMQTLYDSFAGNN